MANATAAAAQKILKALTQNSHKRSEASLEIA
jgi:hypothetical protein